jgi:hypothetical protein
VIEEHDGDNEFATNSNILWYTRFKHWENTKKLGGHKKNKERQVWGDGEGGDQLGSYVYPRMSVLNGKFIKSHNRRRSDIYTAHDAPAVEIVPVAV